MVARAVRRAPWQGERLSLKRLISGEVSAKGSAALGYDVGIARDTRLLFNSFQPSNLAWPLRVRLLGKKFEIMFDCISVVNTFSAIGW